MSDYSLANLQEDDFFLLAAEKGRILTPEAEVARLETFSSLLKTNGEIQDWAKNFLQKVKEDLKLLPHDYS